MVEKRLSVWQRVGFGLLAGIGALFVSSYLELGSHILGPRSPADLSVLGTFWLLGFAPALAWTALTVYLAIRGKLGVHVSSFWVAGAGAAMIFVYIVLRTFLGEMSLEMQFNMDDWRIRLSEQLAVATFFVLVLIGLYLILRGVHRMEFQMREKLLEIEYRLAEQIKGDAKSQKSGVAAQRWLFAFPTWRDHAMMALSMSR